MLRQDLSGIPQVLKIGILAAICLLSFGVRLFAVVRYESVIHEFDPYFNFRTTKVSRPHHHRRALQTPSMSGGEK